MKQIVLKIYFHSVFINNRTQLRENYYNINNILYCELIFL